MDRLTSVTAGRARVRAEAAENHSTCGKASAMIDVMFRHAFALAASVVTDAPKAAVDLTAFTDGARS
ncbi:predicted protein [Streptomyces viridochromogenes DSM 40736]|uniref:Predicted protein n=1 Tax=Streptomyces viridochromogenes (strain DSM 40736 / JCM 4977 / BCRC 1201 / Tue 494) TaxID=591159 RepID=D9XGR4_STRVT|nr:predicted protein [Streptomyces viridochromogenes DSM 40736]